MHNAKYAPIIGRSWAEYLGKALDLRELTPILDFVRQERERGAVYPSGEDIFRAFHLTPFDRVRVVILGQDPYHGAGQAHGLAFSVPAGCRFPPSLRNIFKELKRDLGIDPPFSGDLSPWAGQGVLLLNTCLTVRQGEAGSHQRAGWEKLTDAVIQSLSERSAHAIVFMLWGDHAQRKQSLIDTSRHHILTAPHPSPLSAYKGFLGCGHFSKANELLTAQDIPPIDWSLP